MRGRPSGISLSQADRDLIERSGLRAAARHLGLSYSTLWHHVRTAKAALSTVDAPPLVPGDEVDSLPPPGTRASLFQAELRDLMTRGRWPLVNPDAITVKSTWKQRYSAKEGVYKPIEAAPQTRLSDTPRVAPITDYRGKAFLLTGAQNDAELHQPFWRNLKAYAAAIDAEIVVGPWTYETSWFNENDPAARSYAAEIAPHLCYGQLEIGSDFIFAGEINILPTANSPLSGLKSYSRGRWGVFPHSKVALESLPSTDPSVQARQIMTTGAVTKPCVIPRLAGEKSLFHHCIGATLVEFDLEGRVFCHQINAEDSGRFQHFDAVVDKGRVTYGHRVETIVFADIHTDKAGTKNAVSSFGYDPITRGVFQGSLMDHLRPRKVFVHDLHDHAWGSHHRVGDIGFSYQAAVRGRTSVKAEIERDADLLIGLKRPWSSVVVVESNHDLALERYVKEGRHRGDGINALYGTELEVAYLRHKQAEGLALEAHRKPKRWSMLEHAIREMKGKAVAHVEWAYDGESYVVGAVEHGHHGFRGVNGAKGSPTAFAGLAEKMSGADGHGPVIKDGFYRAGSLELQHGYNRGPSTWAVTHIIQYPSGKRTLVTLQEGRWRADRGRVLKGLAA